MKQFIKVIGIAIFMLALTNCNNKSNNDAVTSYKMVNGLCYNNLNQQVAATSCGNVINSNYYYAANGQCVDRTTGIAVTTTLCQNNAGINGTQQCIGQYIYYNQQYMQNVNVNCGTTNNPPTMYICSGQTLMTVSGQQVTCL